MCEIWANLLLPKALKSCPKSKKSPNLVTLHRMNKKLFFYTYLSICPSLSLFLCLCFLSLLRMLIKFLSPFFSFFLSFFLIFLSLSFSLPLFVYLRVSLASEMKRFVKVQLFFNNHKWMLILPLIPRYLSMNVMLSRAVHWYFRRRDTCAFLALLIPTYMDLACT